MLPNGFVLDCDISFGYKNFSELSDFSKIIVSGAFDCRKLGLHTLEGSPKEVWGNFDCTGNEIRSLIGATVKIGGDFDYDVDSFEFCTIRKKLLSNSGK